MQKLAQELVAGDYIVTKTLLGDTSGTVKTISPSGDKLTIVVQTPNQSSITLVFAKNDVVEIGTPPPVVYAATHHHEETRGYLFLSSVPQQEIDKTNLLKLLGCPGDHGDCDLHWGPLTTPEDVNTEKLPVYTGE